MDIYPLGKEGRSVRVYCDMETDGGGWTVRPTDELEWEEKGRANSDDGVARVFLGVPEEAEWEDRFLQNLE